MTSVNEIGEDWRALGDHAKDVGFVHEAKSFHQCSQDLRRAARLAWRPVSEPPTRADSERGLVAVFTSEGTIATCTYHQVRELSTVRWWARPSDVVLLPVTEGAGE